jgi:3-oxoisoapionate decarboxylase
MATATSNPPLGLCVYSCLVQWLALREGRSGGRFHSALGFVDYALSQGVAGVQVDIGAEDRATALAIRQRTGDCGAYYEGDVRLPRSADDVERFEAELQRAKEAGATVVRSYLTLTRRYEGMRSPADVRDFMAAARQSLCLALPGLQRYELLLGLENHKDLLAAELVALLQDLDSPWIGACIDTGNNLALLEDPHHVAAMLAPYAVTVHLKDMAVRAVESGMTLSEVPLGRGCLDLPRIIGCLRAARPGLRFNLEMVTRDPLLVPIHDDHYWATMPERRDTGLALAERFIAASLSCVLPGVQGCAFDQCLAMEESHNSLCLTWAEANRSLFS